MKKSPAALLALPLVATMLLVGCGRDSKPDASPLSTAISSPTRTSVPTTPSAPPTNTASAKPTTDPAIPAAARAHTPAGAEAFVKYFYSQLNIAWNKPAEGLISRLSATTCKTCSALERSAVDLLSKQHRYRGEVFVAGTIEPIGESEVLVAGEQPPGAVIDSDGLVLRSKAKGQRAKYVVTLAWFPGGWRIQEMKVMK